MKFLLLAAAFLIVAPRANADLQITGGTGDVIPGTVVGAPAADPAGGTYSSAQSVSLSAPDSPNIYYTTNGATPVCDTGTVYTSPILVSANTVINAIACYPDGRSSEVASFTYTITSSGMVVLAGGGGGYYAPPQASSSISTPSSTASSTASSTVAALSDTLARLRVQLFALLEQAYGASGTVMFSKDLWFGMRDADVQRLQSYLNANGFPVAATGPGSKGNETTYFGTKTLQALAAFQKSVGITPAMGYFGPITRAYVNNHLF